MAARGIAPGMMCACKYRRFTGTEDVVRAQDAGRIKGLPALAIEMRSANSVADIYNHNGFTVKRAALAAASGARQGSSSAATLLERSQAANSSGLERPSARLSMAARQVDSLAVISCPWSSMNNAEATKAVRLLPSMNG